MRTRTLALVLAVAMAWSILACGGAAKPPMQPDNDPADGGAEPVSPH